jgi:hypothetical protein
MFVPTSVDRLLAGCLLESCRGLVTPIEANREVPLLMLAALVTVCPL